MKANDLTLNEYSLGVVSTAYINGAAMEYVKSLSVHFEIGKTGVKNVHALAEKYDLGIYFESNGHGSIMYSDKLFNAFKKNNLDQVLLLQNVTTGDAITNLLSVEFMLRQLRWSLADWYNIYTPFVNRQTKISVENKSDYLTNNNETRLIKPDGLQDKIDQTINDFGKSGFYIRAFVRPSGTENILRLYVESDSSTMVDEVTRAIKEIAK